MKPPSHPIINLVLDGLAVAVLGLVILWAANLALNLWIRVRHELRRKKSQPHKLHEKEDGL
jgi:hypothetical protein